MIKYSWNICESERQRILNLHIKATKNHYLNEQTQTDSVFGPVNLGENFEMGRYISANVKDQITKLKPDIEKFIADNNKFSTFVVTIEAGESKVTNYDREPSSNTNGEKLPEGELARKRQNEIEKYFNEIFADLIQSGKLKIVKSEVVIGKTDYSKPEDKSDPIKAKAYKEEQFVRFDVKGTGANETEKKQSMCEGNLQSLEGAYATADNDYLLIQEDDLGQGSGNLTLWFDPIDIPDAIWCEYDGKQYGNRYFFGNTASSAIWKLVMGTALLARFGSDQLPSYYPELQIRKPSIQEIITAVRQDPAEFYQNFGGIFPNQKKIKNPEMGDQWYNIMMNWNGKNVRRLIKDLGPNFPWGWVDLQENYKVGKPYSIVIPKKEGVDNIKIYCINPIGKTRWNITKRCEQEQQY
jgi:hypothetical protein